MNYIFIQTKIGSTHLATAHKKDQSFITFLEMDCPFFNFNSII